MSVWGARSRKTPSRRDKISGLPRVAGRRWKRSTSCSYSSFECAREESNDGFRRLARDVFVIAERHFAAFAFEGERIERRDVGFLAIPGMRRARIGFEGDVRFRFVRQ